MRESFYQSRFNLLGKERLIEIKDERQTNNFDNNNKKKN